MVYRRLRSVKHFSLALLGFLLAFVPAQAQYGPLLTGVGPVNRSMAGTSVAAPLDGLGALYWNPATTSALPGSSLDFGVELLSAPTHLASQLPANAFGRGNPPIALFGSDRGDNGVFPLPSVGLVYRPDDSPWTYGLGVFAVAGFGVNYSASTTNPILMPQPPNGGGLGSIFSEFQVLQIAPTISLQVSDRLSIGGGPTLNLATLRADPLLVASPNANGSYAPGTHTRETWGGGFQAGAFYKLDGGWQVGASFKSPQWFEPFRFQSTDEKGQSRVATFNLDLPMITSVGLAYTGFERWLVATDLRYIDFANANGFRQSGFSPTGAVQGLGFRSIFAVSVGAQYQMTDTLSLRAGYSYNENPIADSQSSFNVASPLVLEHTLYVGASYRVGDSLTLSLAYAHGFQNSIEGPLVTPFGAVPGSSVRNTASMDSLVLGATVRFGACGIASGR